MPRPAQRIDAEQLRWRRGSPSGAVLGAFDHGGAHAVGVGGTLVELGRDREGSLDGQR
ncbi:hypothetical protein OH799_06640 [Nocardia sp. NBC_00881]|uniref:hypothetical protein n=1 Tax=Nocardia sp. NBC_00881 TaxID=2975995 RepID=UPI0038673CDD|nr:hypothetical protein OH799_06640 [Nocardia sp. NBC_00881]